MNGKTCGCDFTAVKDSGERQNFETGSVRDTRSGKGRFDLIPTYPLKRLAVHYENGAKKYGDRNWEKGQPLMRFMDSAMRHLLAVISGETDEDHASAVLWNVMGYMHTEEGIKTGLYPPILDDRPRTDNPFMSLEERTQFLSRINNVEIIEEDDDDDDTVIQDWKDSILPSPDELIKKIGEHLDAKPLPEDREEIDNDLFDLTNPEKRKVLKVKVHYDLNDEIYIIVDRDTNAIYYLNLTEKGIGRSESHNFPYEPKDYIYFIFCSTTGRLIGMAGSDKLLTPEELYSHPSLRIVEFLNRPKVN
jgi:hypothetical protein